MFSVLTFSSTAKFGADDGREGGGGERLDPRRPELKNFLFSPQNFPAPAAVSSLSAFSGCFVFGVLAARSSLLFSLFLPRFFQS